MNNATESDLIRVKENNIPIVICPSSNTFFNLKINYEKMEKINIKLMLGTDNAMINQPNILNELVLYKKMSKNKSIKKLLNMITYNPRKALNLEYNILDFKLLNEFTILDKETLKLIKIPVNHEEI
jgi:cytosine/adenosine deaminase-related metal-dependent hydrolase